MHQARRIANVVPIPKKDGKVRMRVVFRNQNKACLKDDVSHELGYEFSLVSFKS